MTLFIFSAILAVFQLAPASAPELKPRMMVLTSGVNTNIFVYRVDQPKADGDGVESWFSFILCNRLHVQDCEQLVQRRDAGQSWIPLSLIYDRIDRDADLSTALKNVRLVSRFGTVGVTLGNTVYALFKLIRKSPIAPELKTRMIWIQGLTVLFSLMVESSVYFEWFGPADGFEKRQLVLKLPFETMPETFIPDQQELEETFSYLPEVIRTVSRDAPLPPFSLDTWQLLPPIIERPRRQ